MEEKEVEILLKKHVSEELTTNGQSERFVETIWKTWWGLMSTDIKKGIVKAFNEVNNKTK